MEPFINLHVILMQGHANLCIVPVLVNVLPKRAPHQTCVKWMNECPLWTFLNPISESLPWNIVIYSMTFIVAPDIFGLIIAISLFSLFFLSKILFFCFLLVATPSSYQHTEISVFLIMLKIYQNLLPK